MDCARWTRNCRIYSVKCVFYLIKSIHECFCHFLWAAVLFGSDRIWWEFYRFSLLKYWSSRANSSQQQSADTDGRAQVLLHKKALELCARIVSMESKCFMALGQPKKLLFFSFFSFSRLKEIRNWSVDVMWFDDCLILFFSLFLFGWVMFITHHLFFTSYAIIELRLCLTRQKWRDPMRAFLCALLIDDENYVMIIIRFDRVFFVFLIYIITTNTSLFLNQLCGWEEVKLSSTEFVVDDDEDERELKVNWNI